MRGLHLIDSLTEKGKVYKLISLGLCIAIVLMRGRPRTRGEN